MISHLISDENASSIEEEEQRWGMTGKIKSKKIGDIILERQEHWIKDGKNIYNKRIENGKVTDRWTFYRDNNAFYTLELYFDGSSSGASKFKSILVIKLLIIIFFYLYKCLGSYTHNNPLYCYNRVL